MTGTVKLVGEQKPKVKGEMYLGPACVTEARGREVTVELPDGETTAATMALGYLYEAALGDVLLILGKDDRYYGVGVLHGTGRAVLSFQGDVDLHASGGALRLSGDRGVRVEGPEVEVHTGKLRMVADAVAQKFNSVFQRVSSLLHVHAGTSHTVVDGASFTQAESGTILTSETMTINGKQIHLG
jgi:hypothetical protein